MNKIKIDSESWRNLRSEMTTVLMLNTIGNPVLKKENETVKTIYHYTTLHGLISIIENQSIFCSNVNFLNDKKEFKHGVSIIQTVIQKLKSNKNNLPILEMVENNINMIYKSERYVTCFSKNGDLLSQWRAYANHGKGVSIGFNAQHFDKSIKQYIRPKYINYDEKLQLETIEEIIKIILDFCNKRKEMIDWTEYGYEWLVANLIIEYLDDVIAFYKHPSFSEEQEYRFEYSIDGNMIKKDREEIHFKASDTLIVPFIKLKTKYKQYLEDKAKGKYDNHGSQPTFAIEKLPINEIIVGPSLDFDSVELGIQELLEKHKYQDIKIEKSKIPYRI